MLMRAHRPVALAHQNGRALRQSCPCAQAGHVRAYRPRAHTRMPAAYAGRTYRSRRPAGALMRAFRSRMCIPAAHAGRVHRSMCPYAHTGRVRRYRLRILADTPMRAHRPVCPRAHTKVVYPGIPLLIYNTCTSVSPSVTGLLQAPRVCPLAIIGTVHRARCLFMKTHFCKEFPHNPIANAGIIVQFW